MSLRFLAAAACLFGFCLSLSAQPGLIGHWSFDESSGLTVYDQTGNANHGTLVNATRVPGIVGGAVFLDGTGEVDLSIPNNLAPTTGITLEAWYKSISFLGTGNDPIFDRGGIAHDLPAPYQFHLGVQGNERTMHPNNTGDFLFDLGINGGWSQIRKNAIWTPGYWYHVVGTWDGTTQKLYVNGIIVAAATRPGVLSDFGNTMHFGGFSNLPYKLEGTIDELRIYDRALTDDEILYHFHHPGGEVAQTIIRIEKTHNSLQGHFEEVSIQEFFGDYEFGGFDFLLAYDPTGLAFISAEIGSAIDAAGCGWEYFTYRHGAEGNCGGPCPSGLIRIVALADVINGANHPGCFDIPNGGELAKLKFLVTDDRNFECQYLPIRFVWIDCGDNSISSVTGDTLYISDKVFEFENSDPTIHPDFEITGVDCGSSPHYGGACAECDTSLKYEPLRQIYFWNGGIDIVCADSIDARGDLNLNGIAYEIADAVTYTNFFLYGYPALSILPGPREAQIAASDVNKDGIPLTVGDLVYLLRVVVGDALPLPKLAPFAGSTDIRFDGAFTSSSAAQLGAVFAEFKTTGNCTVVASDLMPVESYQADGVLRVLVYPGIENPGGYLESGTHTLSTVTGAAQLSTVQASDAQGNLLSVSLRHATLPSEFQLSQNVPNPFNPSTRITLNLPVHSDWRLEIINVAGQTVSEFTGRGVGLVSVDWDARSMPSGVYFYRATAGSESATRKMLLLK